MKVYLYLNIRGFSNCYLIVNENTNEAIIIDPGKITENLISQIENRHINLIGVLITHNHGSHVDGLKVLQKIYSPKVYAADWNIAKNESTILTGDGKIELADMIIEYMFIPGHTSDSVVFKIGNILFTGDVISVGAIGSTNSSYSEYILKSNIEQKIYSQKEQTILMPGHGPPSTLKAIKQLYKL